MYKEIKGDLIELALQGNFDVITHGCNCFCTMGAGIAPKMAKAFGCDKFKMESNDYKSDINKLGCIDYDSFDLCKNDLTLEFKVFQHSKIRNEFKHWNTLKTLTVINSYTQYGFGSNHLNGTKTPLDYEALTLCMRKINHKFKGKHIGLPRIGCGLAGGDWNMVKSIIQKELKNCDVTVVIYDK